MRKKNTGNCTWNNGDSRGFQISRTQVERLQRRVEELEKGGDNPHSGPGPRSPGVGMELEQDTQDAIPEYDLSQMRTLENVPHSLERAPPDRSSRAIQQVQRPPHFIPLSTALTGPSLRTSVSAGNSCLEISASGMIGSLPEDGQSHEYFGSSSAGCFINQVRWAVKQKMRQTELSTLSQQNDVSSGQRRPVVQQPRISAPDLALPTRSKADQLIQIYWDIVHVLYPFVDKEETIHKYQNLWTGQTEYEEDYMFVCILNVIFALTFQLNRTIEARSREKSAEMYYQRAKELLDICSTGTFESIQVYLLLGQYFQSTNEPHQCWMMIGAAIRTAQSLGLHLPDTTERISPLRRRESIRKVWHGCIIMDRIVSMTYGRPPMINTSLAAAVPRPLAIDEEHLPREHGVQVPQPHKPSILDSLELYDILYDVLVGFYSSSSAGSLSVNEAWEKYLGRSGIDSKFSTLDIERRLVQWESRLPSHLKLNGSDEQTGPNKYFTRQAVILHQRDLHIRLLSLRPVLSAYLSSDTSNAEVGASFGGHLSQRVALQCATMCVTVAQETIDLAYSRRPFDPNSVGPIAAWWYNVLFIYSAATVLVAAKLCPSILSEIPEESISHSWGLAIEIVQCYQGFSPVIEQLVAALHLLFNILPEHYLQSKEAAWPEAHGTRASSGDGQEPGTFVPTDSQAGQLKALGNEPMRMDDATMPLDRGLGNSDFDFLFDNYDPSWLHTLPFDS